MKEQIKTTEKNTIKQRTDSQPIRCTLVMFRTLVIRKLTELVEFGRKLDEKMKAMLRKTKENVQGTSSDMKETGTQINGVDQK